MHIQNIETADCKILSTEILPNEIRVYFESVYDLKKKQHVNNIGLVITGWSHFEAKIYTSKEPDSIHEEKKLPENDLELFEYIQTITHDENEIIIQGYSKNSRYWLEYHFIKCECYLINSDKY